MASAAAPPSVAVAAKRLDSGGALERPQPAVCDGVLAAAVMWLALKLLPAAAPALVAPGRGTAALLQVVPAAARRVAPAAVMQVMPAAVRQAVPAAAARRQRHCPPLLAWPARQAPGPPSCWHSSPALQRWQLVELVTAAAAWLLAAGWATGPLVGHWLLAAWASLAAGSGWERRGCHWTHSLTAVGSWVAAAW